MLVAETPKSCCFAIHPLVSSCKCWNPKVLFLKLAWRDNWSRKPLYLEGERWYPVDVPSKSMIFHYTSIYFMVIPIDLMHLHVLIPITGCPCGRPGKVIAPMWGACNAVMWYGRPRGSPPLGHGWHGSPPKMMLLSWGKLTLRIGKSPCHTMSYEVHQLYLYIYKWQCSIIMLNYQRVYYLR
jgi:hypothetical protein